MNVAIFCNIAPCNQYVKRRFGGMYDVYLQGRKSAEQGPSVQQVLHIRTTLHCIADDDNILMAF
jgi:hypothetical protein